MMMGTMTYNCSDHIGTGLKGHYAVGVGSNKKVTVGERL